MAGFLDFVAHPLDRAAQGISDIASGRGSRVGGMGALALGAGAIVGLPVALLAGGVAAGVSYARNKERDAQREQFWAQRKSTVTRLKSEGATDAEIRQFSLDANLLSNTEDFAALENLGTTQIEAVQGRVGAQALQNGAMLRSQVSLTDLLGSKR